MQAGVGLLVLVVMPIYMIIALNIVITMCFSINCPTVICSPIVCYVLEREVSMAPGSIFIILIFQHLVIFIAFYFTLHLYHKNTNNIMLSYLSDLTLVSDCVGIDNPLSRWLRGFICFV